MQKTSKRGTLGLNQFSDWEVGSAYSIEKSLGKGSYGEVVCATHTPSG